MVAFSFWVLYLYFFLWMMLIYVNPVVHPWAVLFLLLLCGEILKFSRKIRSWKAKSSPQESSCGYRLWSLVFCTFSLPPHSPNKKEIGMCARLPREVENCPCQLLWKLKYLGLNWKIFSSVEQFLHHMGLYSIILLFYSCMPSKGWCRMSVSGNYYRILTSFLIQQLQWKWMFSGCL